jgi:hypothetical protein
LLVYPTINNTEGGLNEQVQQAEGAGMVPAKVSRRLYAEALKGHEYRGCNHLHVKNGRDDHLPGEWVLKTEDERFGGYWVPECDLMISKECRDGDCEQSVAPPGIRLFQDLRYFPEFCNRSFICRAHNYRDVVTGSET